MKKAISGAAMALSFAMLMGASAQAQDKPDWCKSKWGPDDEIAASLIAFFMLPLPSLPLLFA